MNKTIYFHHFVLVNPGVLDQRHPAGRRADHRGLKVDSGVQPIPPVIHHIARFPAGISTRQVEKQLQAIKTEPVTQA